MLDNKNVLKILSLLIAILLWVYVMGEVNPETQKTISDIEVTFVNTEALAERGLAVVQDEDMSISAVVKGKRSAVNDAKNAGITATVDVSEGSKGNNSGDVELQLPEGVTLDSVSQESIQYRVEDSVEKEIDVEIEFVGDTSEDNSDMVPWAYDTDPDKVTVIGAESVIDEVSVVQGTITSNVVSRTPKDIDVELTAVKEDGTEIGGLVLSDDKATTTVQLMELKDVDVTITPQNLESGFEVDSISGVDSVKVIGSSDALADLSTLQASVDLSGVTKRAKKEISIDLPDGVYLYSEGNETVVTVKVKTAE